VAEGTADASAGSGDMSEGDREALRRFFFLACGEKDAKNEADEEGGCGTEGCVTKDELRSGLDSLGYSMSDEEMDHFWVGVCSANDEATCTFRDFEQGLWPPLNLSS
jgi:hypothetical protein